MPNLTNLHTLMYLRKSRADLEAEARGEGDTLARHRTQLLDYARKTGLSVGAIYEEVVSGETIAARPQMQRLLSEVEAGMWQAVLVVEISRLARGDTSDQGIVANTFKYSGTLIVTPSKVYDPDNESDEEYFEFGLFMSRREYKMINRRLKAGRLASMREGKYVGSVPPFGYEIIKLKGEKGNSLRPVPEQAAIIQRIYREFLSGRSQNAIAEGLNQDGILSARGKLWTVASIRDILRNAHYAGYTSSGFRPLKKVMRDGKLISTRPKNLELTLYPGRHEGLISPEDYEKTLAILRTHKAPPIPKIHGASNALSGLLLCDQCGKKMQRRPFQNGRIAQLLCTTKGCPTVSHDVDEVEALILAELRNYLKDFSVEEQMASHFAPDMDAKRKAIADIDQQLAVLAERQDKIYELVETGVYTADVFQERFQALTKERAALISSKTALTADIYKMESILSRRANIIPRIQHVLDVYDLNASPYERNQLLKSILESVTYHKTISLRWKDKSDLSITIHPKFDFV